MEKTDTPPKTSKLATDTEDKTSDTEDKTSDNSTITLLISIVVLILYYMFLKPVLELNILENIEDFSKYVRQKYIMMIVLFCILFGFHMLGNVNSFQQSCGGSITDNIGKVFISTFVPWLLIFGTLMIVLIIFPGFKGAFSNVIGYYAVYRGANEILVNILGNGTIDQEIDSSDATDADKGKLEKASDAVLKLVGNTSILINQITPENFSDMWSMMTPIMKPSMRGSGGDRLKAELLKSVILRDNIGEFCWYLYTTLLLMVVVKTMIMKQKCTTTLSQLKENVGEYDDKESIKKQAQLKADSVVYKG